jgi:hypothetical protein
MGDNNMYGLNRQTGTECGVFKNGMITKNLDGYFVFQEERNNQYPVQKCESYSDTLGPQNCTEYQA